MEEKSTYLVFFDSEHLHFLPLPGKYDIMAPLFFAIFILSFSVLLWYMSYSSQREVASASDEACREYKSNTPLEDQTARGIWEVMEKAAKTTIKNIRSHEFEKYLAVADPGNGDEFFSEVFP